MLDWTDLTCKRKANYQKALLQLLPFHQNLTSLWKIHSSKAWNYNKVIIITLNPGIFSGKGFMHLTGDGGKKLACDPKI